MDKGPEPGAPSGLKRRGYRLQRRRDAFDVFQPGFQHLVGIDDPPNLDRLDMPNNCQTRLRSGPK